MDEFFQDMTTWTEVGTMVSRIYSNNHRIFGKMII